MYLMDVTDLVTSLATLILVAITGFYAYWTKGILTAALSQPRLSLAPAISIEIKRASITPTLPGGNRNMSVEVVIANIGTSPAIEVVIDSEIELRHQPAETEKVIPARYSHMIPFVVQGDKIELPPVISYGHTFIERFIESARAVSDPSQLKASILTVMAYYKNTLGQHFKTSYTIDIGFLYQKTEHGERGLIPSIEESCELDLLYRPSRAFRAGLIEESEVTKEIEHRDARRDLSGW